jgi:hypothetical protein
LSETETSLTAATASDASRVRSLMPRLRADLSGLVATPSVSAAGYPEETRPALLEAHDLIVGLLREAGVKELDSLDLPDTAPVIVGRDPGAAGRADGAAVRSLRRRSRRRGVEMGLASVRGERARRRDLRPRRRWARAATASATTGSSVSRCWRSSASSRSFSSRSCGAFERREASRLSLGASRVQEGRSPLEGGDRRGSRNRHEISQIRLNHAQAGDEPPPAEPKAVTVTRDPLRRGNDCDQPEVVAAASAAATVTG